MDPVRGRALWGLLVLATLIGGCGGNDSAGVDGSTTSTSAQGDRSTPVVVDTDLAGDDIVALAYLASNPRVDLLAVSVSGTGEVTCPRGAEIATALLAELGRRDVPVACGVSEPLSGNRQFPNAWREAADNAWDLELREVAVPDDAPDAVALLTERISSAARPVTVLTLGPLTNVAQLLIEHPDLVAAIARLVVMGGAVDVPGNVQLDGAATPLEAEWNFYIDPRAAAVVVASGAPVTLVTLDATNSVPVTDTSLELLTANDVTSATAVARHLFERYPPPYLWDPLAAIAVSDPDLLPVRNINIDVVTEGAESGRTIERAGRSEVEMLAAPDDPAAVVRFLVQVLARQDELITPTTPPTIGEVSLSFDGLICQYEGPERPSQGNYLVDLRPGRVQFWGVIAQLVAGTTMEEATAWIVEHPNEQPPMIEEIATIGEGVLEPPGSVEFRRGTVGVACLTEDDTFHVAISVEVRP